MDLGFVYCFFFRSINLPFINIISNQFDSFKKYSNRKLNKKKMYARVRTVNPFLVR